MVLVFVRLCKEHSEDIQHIFIRCKFTKDVWSVVINSLQIWGVWDKESVSLCFPGLVYNLGVESF
jgi:hypothetical protein